MYRKGEIIFLKSLISFISIIFLTLPSGCTTKQGYSHSPDTDTLQMQLERGELRQKTDRLLVVIDGQKGLNLEQAYDLLQGIKETIPPQVSYEKIFRIYGWNIEPFAEDISILFGLHQLTYPGIEKMIVTKTLPDSEIFPLSLTLDSLVMELAKAGGNSALIVISNGKGIHPEDFRSAKYLKKDLGEQICFYPILMGDSEEGAEDLAILAEIGECGYPTSRKDLLLNDELTNFVRDIFFAPIEPLPETKEIPSLEKMLGKDKKIKFVLNVEFDFDKIIIRSGFQDELGKTARFLQTYPQTKAHLVGHTDSVGSESYNQKLSFMRAKAVRQYLIDNYGIEPERLTVEGAGELEPIADNASELGRQRNRRVVAIITRQVKEFRSN